MHKDIKTAPSAPAIAHFALSGGYFAHAQEIVPGGITAAVSPNERFNFDGSFDSNQREEICIDLNSSEERHSLAQLREGNEDPQANRNAHPKTP
jgi:hypothetical protein